MPAKQALPVMFWVSLLGSLLFVVAFVRPECFEEIQVSYRAAFLIVSRDFA
jgi:lipid-A-disaccharide synthase-like uncharacterized protein